LNDDGTPVEPVFYAPILPMILVNGTKGIGTGFSTDIPCFNPKELIDYILKKMEDPNHIRDFIPYYKHFTGTIEKEDSRRFITKGKYSIQNKTIIITELPIGVWNEDYITHLEKCIVDNKLKDYSDQSTDSVIYFKLTLKENMDEEAILKTFKLTTTLSINNMNLFDPFDKLVHYNEVHEICDDFIQVRLGYYEKRKLYLVKMLSEEMNILSNKCKYINELLNDTLDLRKKSNSQMVELLQQKKYDTLNDSYHYLIKMPMDSVCKENVDTLNEQFKKKKDLLDELNKTSNVDLWKKELSELKEML
jgi:DNA topoisomerase-2